jgi:hypothetical protein
LNLATVTVDAFTSLVGDSFVLERSEDKRVTLRLTGATPSSHPGPEGTRQPFTLTFDGPVEPLLEQRIYRLEHDDAGVLEIFIVPIGRDESRTAYEAVFN